MTAAKNKGLGRGLGALLGNEAIPDNESRTILDLSIHDVAPNDNQPRKYFDKDRLQGLSNSIQDNGVIQPIIVTKEQSGYQIVAGERRWRAAKLAGLKTIPAIVKELSNVEILQQALIENVQRQDLNPIETAEALSRLMSEHNMTQEKLSTTVGMSRSNVANTLRLLNLSSKVKKMIIADQLSQGHARSLLALPDKATQEAMADKIVELDLSVRDTEKLVKKLLEPKVELSSPEQVPVDEAYQLSIKTVEDELTRVLGTKVSLKDKKKKGQIVIEYYSLDDLERIMELMRQKEG